VSDGPAATGGCLCGAIRYELRGTLRPVINCHCKMCQRAHGHFAAYTSLAAEGLTLAGAEALAWYRSSDLAERGFCRRCGSSLFWRPLAGGTVSVAAGSLDEPTGLATAGHIFVDEQGSYYELTDALPKRRAGRTGPLA
jgi:hypothetical protein